MDHLGLLTGMKCACAYSNYSASKAALIRATASIQAEFTLEGKEGVKLFSLHPGGVKSSMNSGITWVLKES